MAYPLQPRVCAARNPEPSKATSGSLYTFAPRPQKKVFLDYIFGPLSFMGAGPLRDLASRTGPGCAPGGDRSRPPTPWSTGPNTVLGGTRPGAPAGVDLPCSLCGVPPIHTAALQVMRTFWNILQTCVSAQSK